ncbi:hybrid sensor histidine kinase/response regulator [Calothrix sp. FACHB-156]|nr:hybrid sensor histidine kinase/response regulator [Calothrix sp. FACHB-156]
MESEILAVLLVEDNPADVAILTELLQDSDAKSWQITHFKRLQLALKQLQHTDCDVILLDLSLPDSQGLDTVIQMQAAVPHLPIVVLTGLQDKKLALEALAVGAQDYLVKGQISSQLLVKTVEYAIKRMQILRKEQELSQMRARFISTASHEFRTPLTIIASSTEYLAAYSYRVSQEKQQQHLERIDKAIKHMTQLLDDVLMLNITDLDQWELNLEQVDVVRFCHDLIEHLAANICEHRIVFVASQNNSMLATFPARIDQKIIRLILTNLINNALKYSPQDSMINFYLTVIDSEIILQIQDYGVGISQEDQINLFQPFQRARNVGSIAGTGLGLSIVKRCVDLHKGKITVSSKVGEGTTFTVNIPYFV